MSAWTDLFDELLRVYRDTSSLLSDAEGILVETSELRPSYGTQPGRVAREEGSDQLRDPDRWFSSWFARYYRRASDGDKTGPVAWVAVFLGDRGGRADWASDGRLETPIVTAGVRWWSGKGQNDQKDDWACKAWFRTDGHALDGVPRPRAVVLETGTLMFVSLAVPISELTSREEVRTRIASPLVAILSAGAPQTSGANTPPTTPP